MLFEISAVKGQDQYFSMQVVVNKTSVFSKPWKKWRKYVLSFSSETQKPLNSDAFHSEKMTSPRWRLGYSNDQLY